MIRPEKVAAVKEIQDRLGRAKSVVLVNYRGLDSGRLTELRKMLRAAKVEMKVVKNSALAIASRDLGFTHLENMLAGPTALVIGYEDELQAAKAIVGFAKENKELEIKGGILEGKGIDAKQVSSLAEIPGREVLLGRLVGMLQAPISRLAFAFSAPISQLVTVIDQVRASKGATEQAVAS
ncbi:MAG TPA: 50S ribosomal protein L10 [Firmicutes bacterium]|nr:50S ribosomal protein L10 [Bacillota bacterium]